MDKNICHIKDCSCCILADTEDWDTPLCAQHYVDIECEILKDFIYRFKKHINLDG